MILIGIKQNYTDDKFRVIFQFGEQGVYCKEYISETIGM